MKKQKRKINWIGFILGIFLLGVAISPIFTGQTSQDLFNILIVAGVGIICLYLSLTATSASYPSSSIKLIILSLLIYLIIVVLFLLTVLILPHIPRLPQGVIDFYNYYKMGPSGF